MLTSIKTRSAAFSIPCGALCIYTAGLSATSLIGFLLGGQLATLPTTTDVHYGNVFLHFHLQDVF